MSLKKEWEELRLLAVTTLDNLAHLDAVMAHERKEKRAVVLGLRVGGDGDVQTCVDREATPELLRLHLDAARTMLALREARVELVARILGAAL
jgi:hypothetical protein